MPTQSASNKKLKVLFHIEQDDDGYPPVSVEGIWVRSSGTAWLIDNIPFHVYGVAPGDLVSVKCVGDEKWFDKVLQPSGVSVFRVFAKNCDAIPRIREALLDLGCPSEVHAAMGLIAVEVPVGANIAGILDFLMAEKGKNCLDFEEGVLRHELPK